MRGFGWWLRWLFAAAAAPAGRLTAATPSPIVAVHGVLRDAQGREPALWGVNYEFNLSWEYRTYFKPLGVPLTLEALRAIADRDLDDLARLRVQVVRAHLLPADFTDARGELVDTIFLQALDYLVAGARRRGMYVFFSLFNRMDEDYLPGSFAAARFGPGDGGRAKAPYLFDPVLAGRFAHYVGCLMNRHNPLLGRRYAAEPAIAGWELMNEPEYPELTDVGKVGYERIRADWTAWRRMNPEREAAAAFRRYRGERLRQRIDQLCGAVRATGATQPIFWSFNWRGFISGYPEVAAAARASGVDGISFCLYPGQDDLPQPIDFQHLPSLAARNYLPLLRNETLDWSELRRARAAGKAVAVYEFETWCNDSAYAYPAMARLFRQLGAQIACMWEYDPAVAAEYNLVASHFLNLRASPAKAGSFLVAGEVFRRTPRAGSWKGERLDERAFRFGPFGASFAADTSWYIGTDTLIYSRGLPAGAEGLGSPVAGRAWREIVGTGSSAAVEVSGNGLYWFERNAAGYLLTLMPDAEVISDLWRNVWDGPPPRKIRLRSEVRQVRLRIPGWNGTFAVKPGQYQLQRDCKHCLLVSKICY